MKKNIVTSTISASFALFVAVWAFHQVTPEGMQWLNEDRLAKLQSLLIVGCLYHRRRNSS